jgi:hypothetical protein
VKKEFTPWQRAALTHPHDVDVTDEPHPACMHLPAKDRSVILTCDIDIETAQTFGGPVWHVSVWPPSRTRAAAVLSGVGEGVLFDEPGVHSKILHLRRRMTTEEMKRLGDNGQ